MKIVIPMSGYGKRFLNAGYTIPKPLIDIWGKKIIEHIVCNFSEEDEFIFICRNDDLARSDLNLKSYLENLMPKTTVIGIKSHSLGPIYAIMQIEYLFQRNESVIVNYCDFDWRWDYYKFKCWLKEEDPDSALCVYQGFHPHYFTPTNYAYIKDFQNHLISIQEKKPYTNYRQEEPAASGTFYFKHSDEMFKNFRAMISEKDVVNNEYYVSLVFNYFKKNGCRNLIYYIKHFMQWGTPKDLDEYKFWTRKIVNPWKKIEVSGFNHIITMAGKGERFQKLRREKKPYISINSKVLFEETNINFVKAEKKIHAINGDLEDMTFFREKNCYNYCSVGETRDTCQTLFYAIKQETFDKSLPLLVTPCDTGIDFDVSRIRNHLRTKDAGCIVFGHKNYSFAKRNPQDYGWIQVKSSHKVVNVGYKKGWDKDRTRPIVTGCFVFKSAKYFSDHYSLFLKKNSKETSLDEFANYLINCDEIVLYEECQDMLCLGTPNEFRCYEYWIDAYKSQRLTQQDSISLAGERSLKIDNTVNHDKEMIF